jgi:hypothetical protein
MQDPVNRPILTQPGRVLLVGAEPGAVAPAWVAETAAALLGQPLEVLGPVPARWQDAQLTADLAGLDAMQRVLLERLMRG